MSVQYDPNCDRLDTAIRAVFLLWRRGKLNLLYELGMELVVTGKTAKGEPIVAMPKDVYSRLLYVQDTLNEAPRAKNFDGKTMYMIQHVPELLVPAMSLQLEYKHQTAFSRSYQEKRGKIA